LRSENFKKRVRLLVSGRVQGVYFRAHTVSVALRFGVTGWVRNCGNGQVEALLEGRQSDIDRVIQICRQGHPGSHVTDIEIKWEEPSGEFDTFDIKY